MSDTVRSRMMIALAIVGSAIFMRLVPHVPNFAPVTAAALFGAAYLPKKYALLVPIVAVALSDYLLLYVDPFSAQIFDFSKIQPLSALVHGTTPWVWGSFMVSGLLGLLLRPAPSGTGLREKRGVVRTGMITGVASLQFFLITNFGVWAAGAYARDFSGLMASYAAGLPFLRWTVLGDFFFVASFFGLYALTLRQAQRQPKQSADLTSPVSA